MVGSTALVLLHSQRTASAISSGRPSGAIVNNSSIGGLIGIAGRATYHATKHGVIGLTKSAALEYAAGGIRINAVCPGTIDTPMVAAMLAKEPDAMKDVLRDLPIGRLGRPEEIADAVLWLCSPGAGFVIGHALVIDGGYTVRSVPPLRCGTGEPRALAAQKFCRVACPPHFGRAWWGLQPRHAPAPPADHPPNLPAHVRSFGEGKSR